MSEFIIDFPGGARVDAHYGSYTVHTDQPRSGGVPVHHLSPRH